MREVTEDLETIYDEPDWQPFFLAIRLYLDDDAINWDNTLMADDWMYMRRVGDIRLYKNDRTREYLNVDSQGRLWQYTGRGNIYERIR